MTKDRPRNIAASVRQRLMNKAREQKEDFNLVLIRYALERLLYRLSLSPYQDRFVLKGAMLFQVWSGQVHRPTRDLDLLGHGGRRRHLILSDSFVTSAIRMSRTTAWSSEPRPFMQSRSKRTRNIRGYV
jgi:hypothetical protein